MLDFIYDQVERHATWPVVVLLFVLFLICAQLFGVRQKSLGYENPSPDARFWYTSDAACEFFQAIGERGRRIYALTEVTLDLLFPLVYGTLFATMLIHLYSHGWARVLLLVPVIAVCADLLENSTLAYLACRFDGVASPLARFAALFTAVKTVLFIASTLLLLTGAVMGIGRPHGPPV